MAYKNNVPAQPQASAPVPQEKIALSLATKATKWIMDDVANPEKNIKVPEGYNMGTEVTSAMLDIFQNPSTANCSDESILTAVRNMVLQGLSSNQKQCYFVNYGGKLQLMRSYFGTVATLKQAFPYFEIFADVLYKGSGYVIKVDPVLGFKYLEVTSLSLEDMDNDIAAAYGYIIDTRSGKKVYGLIMTWKEIQKSWSKARSNNVQQDFPQEMAKRTLIQRMCKMFVNSAPAVDSAWAKAFNDTTKGEYAAEEQPEPAVLERAKAARSKSKGAQGLRSITEQKEEDTDPPFNPETGEIIGPVPAVDAPAGGPETFEDDTADLFGNEPGSTDDLPYTQEIPF